MTVYYAPSCRLLCWNVAVHPVPASYSWHNELPSLPVRTDTSFDKHYRPTDWTAQAWHAVEQASSAPHTGGVGGLYGGRLIGGTANSNRRAPGHAVPLSSTPMRHMTTANKKRPWLCTNVCTSAMTHLDMPVDTYPSHVLFDKNSLIISRVQ